MNDDYYSLYYYCIIIYWILCLCFIIYDFLDELCGFVLFCVYFHAEFRIDLF